MTVTTFDNAPPLPDWEMPARVTLHCGDIVTDLHCAHCGEWVDPRIRHIDISD